MFNDPAQWKALQSHLKTAEDAYFHAIQGIPCTNLETRTALAEAATSAAILRQQLETALRRCISPPSSVAR